MVDILRETATRPRRRHPDSMCSAVTGDRGKHRTGGAGVGGGSRGRTSAVRPRPGNGCSGEDWRRADALPVSRTPLIVGSTLSGNAGGGGGYAAGVPTVTRRDAGTGAAWRRRSTCRDGGALLVTRPRLKIRNTEQPPTSARTVGSRDCPVCRGMGDPGHGPGRWTGSMDRRAGDGPTGARRRDRRAIPRPPGSSRPRPPRATRPGTARSSARPRHVRARWPSPRRDGSR